MFFLLFFLALYLDLRRLGAIVDRAFLEPRMLESLFGGNAALGIVDENLAKEVEELFVEGCGCRDEVLKMMSVDKKLKSEVCRTYVKMLHSLHILLRSPGRLIVRIIELASGEVSVFVSIHCFIS